MELYRSHVLVCGGTGCSSSGSAKLIERFEEQLKEKGLDKEVKVVRTSARAASDCAKRVPLLSFIPKERSTAASRLKTWTRSCPSTC